YGRALEHDIVNDRLARFEMRQGQVSALPVHSSRVSKAAVRFAYQNESAFGAADLERRFQNFLEGRVRREELLPLVLEIQDAGNLFEIGRGRRQHDTEIHE